ncbi:hypothetical protein KSP39_PZI017248 [Platanthera zijinensis]|uniref:Reverse transcriptase Ty1/copia-type domain-containing protein n=1 Tax=Platanthera zijinensis TaxID=2320716 RepID=A0AAP0G005_9ASPA
MLVGYSRTQKGYVCFDPTTGKMVVSADVSFHEDQPYHTSPSDPLLPPPLPRPSVPVTSPLPPLLPTPQPHQSKSPITPSIPPPTVPSKPPVIQVYTRHPPRSDALQQLPSTGVLSRPVDPASSSTTHPMANYVSLHRLSPPLLGRLKARLVARGFAQQYDLDYEETFSPVAKLNSVWVLFSLAVHRQWPLYQLDVKNAFLNDDLLETVYMHQPLGFETTEESRVCLLRKSIYGLKQSPRASFEKFSKVVREVGFKQSSVDSSLFTRYQSTRTVILLVYVDDILITSDDSAGIHHVKQHLNSTFQIEDLGNICYFLGLEVARRPDGLVLSQRKYCIDLLQDAGLSSCTPAETPMEFNHMSCAQGSENDSLLPNPEYYCLLVGKLIYLTVTRPDISFAVCVVNRFMHTPWVSHLQAVERILRYLKTSPGQGLVYKPSSSLSLIAYSDADYVGSLDDRRSTTGFCTYFGGNLITWRSKKQTMVARSSAEAEYRAMMAVTSEITWLESFLVDLGVKLSSPSTLFYDSQAAIYIAKNPVFHERTKHIEVDCHFVREKVQAKELKLEHVPASGQVADIFTKALPRKLYYQFLSKLGAYNLYAPACGGVLDNVEENNNFGVDNFDDFGVDVYPNLDAPVHGYDDDINYYNSTVNMKEDTAIRVDHHDERSLRLHHYISSRLHADRIEYRSGHRRYTSPLGEEPGFGYERPPLHVYRAHTHPRTSDYVRDYRLDDPQEPYKGHHRHYHNTYQDSHSIPPIELPEAEFLQLVIDRFDLFEAKFEHLRSTLRRKSKDLGQATDGASSASIEIRDPTLGDPFQFDEIQYSCDLEVESDHGLIIQLESDTSMTSERGHVGENERPSDTVMVYPSFSPHLNLLFPLNRDTVLDTISIDPYLSLGTPYSSLNTISSHFTTESR